MFEKSEEKSDSIFPFCKLSELTGDKIKYLCSTSYDIKLQDIDPIFKDTNINAFSTVCGVNITELDVEDWENLTLGIYALQSEGASAGGSMSYKIVYNHESQVIFPPDYSQWFECITNTYIPSTGINITSLTTFSTFNS